jgi:hypothetical protein
VPTAERVAKNESLFREVNEQILELEESFGTRSAEESLPGFVCECASDGCSVIVAMSLDEYRLARETPTRFLVAPGHADPEHERIVMRTDRFELVEKFSTAGEIAAAKAE